MSTDYCVTALSTYYESLVACNMRLKVPASVVCTGGLGGGCGGVDTGPFFRRIMLGNICI